MLELFEVLKKAQLLPSDKIPGIYRLLLILFGTGTLFQMKKFESEVGIRNSSRSPYWHAQST